MIVTKCEEVTGVSAEPSSPGDDYKGAITAVFSAGFPPPPGASLRKRLEVDLLNATEISVTFNPHPTGSRRRPRREDSAGESISRLGC